MKNPLYLDPWSRDLIEMRGWTYHSPSRAMRFTFKYAYNARKDHRMIGLRLFRGLK